MIDLSQQGFSHDEIVKMLADPLGNRKVQFFMDVYRNGGYYKRLSFIDCSMECNAYNAVKFFASFSLYDPPTFNFNSDRFQPVMLYEFKGTLFEFTFFPVKILESSEQIVNGKRRVSLTGYDESIVLQENTLGDRLVIKAGERYVDVIWKLISRAGFSDIEISPSDRVFLYDRDDWAESTSLLSVINQLLEEIDYRTLEPSVDGTLKSFPYTLPSYNDVKIQYSYKHQRILMSGVTFSGNAHQSYNRFIGHISNPELGDPLRYEYINQNEGHPASTVNQGYIFTAPPRNFEGIETMNELISAVHRWAAESDDQENKIEVKTAIMPQHEVREVLSIETKELFSAYTEVAWKIDSFRAGGIMMHSLREVFY